MDTDFPTGVTGSTESELRARMLGEQDAVLRAWIAKHRGTYPVDPDSVADGEAHDLIVPDAVRAELNTAREAVRTKYAAPRRGGSE